MAAGEQQQFQQATILLCFDNFAMGTSGATVSANSSSGGDLVVANLLTPWLDEHYRTGEVGPDHAAKAPIRITWDLGRPRSLDTLTLHRHNIREPLVVRWFKQSPAASSPIWESDPIDPIIRARMRDFNWKDMPWNLGPRSVDLDHWQQTYQLDSIVQSPEVHHGVRFVQLEAPVTGLNNGVPWYQIGYPGIWRSFQPEINMVLGWGLEGVDRSEVDRTDAGALVGRARNIGKKLTFTLSYLERDEAFGRVFNDYVMAKGKLERVFVVVEPEQRRHFYAQRMVATATKLPRARMPRLEWPSAEGWVLESTE